ncbi:hypothetical protein NC652_028148 [Populus alba x Populus x berolinensis]|nr:hypothetical protein NC652_028148 [Populus alba x Populus x berolinensis]
MAFRPTKARACFTVARNIAAMFLETRTTVDNVVKSANLESLAAMEDVQTSFTTPVIVENATISVPRGLNVNMEHVVEYTESKVCVTNKESLYGDGGDSQSCLLIETYRCSDPREGECLIAI